ncbi:MAG TPA: methionyl-tRNA formyltransferase [Dehalococcoidia bacterium]|nr:methionyl-tRNA formyltransferase [Dehalococcoidia bacterium]
MRVVFLGSPDFALPALRALIERGHEIVGVYTQPDRPVGRGRRTAPPPVKALALEHGLRVLQPHSISSPDAVAELRALAPDVAVIAAYGQILRQRVLDVPPMGVLNVHASLLPRWRGAAPIPAAILAGDAATGATIMWVRLALDAGPMLARAEVPISSDDTTATLTARIAEAGARLLVEVLPKWAAGDIEAEEQDEALVTYAPQIKKADALIDWERDTAETVCRKVRAYNPWPVAYGLLDGQPLRLLECAPAARPVEADAGTILAAGTGFCIVTADAAVVVARVQGPGGRPMAAGDYLRGHRGIIGARLAGRT